MNEIKGLVVTLDKDFSETEVEGIINAIKMIKGILDVGKSNLDVSDYLNRNRVRLETERKVYDAIRNVFKESDFR